MWTRARCESLVFTIDDCINYLVTGEHWHFFNTVIGMYMQSSIGTYIFALLIEFGKHLNLKCNPGEREKGGGGGGGRR